MTIRQRGKDAPCSAQFQLEGRTYCFTFNGKKGMPIITSRREAREYEHELLRQLKTGTMLQHTELKNFARFFNEIYLGYSRAHKSELAQQFDTIYGKRLVDAFGDKTLQQISPRMIEEFLAKLLKTKTRYGREFSPVTVRRFYDMLNCLYNLAIRERISAENPCRLVDRRLLAQLPTWENRDRWLNKYTADEEERLFAAFNEYGDHLAALTHIVLNMGVRPQCEGLKIRREHVNLTDGGFYYRVGKRDVLLPPHSLIIEKGKDGKPRVLPLNETARRIFSLLIQDATSRVWLFENRDGSRIKSVRKGFHAACTRAGIEDLRPYDLRHTFATRLVERGIHEYIISELLGHSRRVQFGTASRVTPGYAHVTWEAMRAAVHSLEHPPTQVQTGFTLKSGKSLANEANGGDLMEALSA